MLLRAKIRSGEEDLALFESLLLEDSSLQRAHSSPTLQDSSQASQVSQMSSSRDGANSSKASGCSSSSKHRQEGQRNSYRQAVKKWGVAGAPGAVWRCTASSRLSPCIGFYLRSRRVWSSDWRGNEWVGPHPTPCPNHDSTPGSPSFHLIEVLILWLAERLGKCQRECWCRRWEEELGGQTSAGKTCVGGCWMQQQTAQSEKAGCSLTEQGTTQGTTSSKAFSSTPLFF